MSCDTPNVNLKILQGITFSRVLRLGDLPFIYKPITAITQTAPVHLTVTAHGIPDGWPVAVVSVNGMRQINADADSKGQPTPASYAAATVIDANTIELNAVNAAGFNAYTSGGYAQFFTPTDFTGATIRLTIRDQIGGTALVSLDSSGHGITIDNTAKTVTITIDATTTAGLTWNNGVYEAEIQFLDGTVKPMMRGNVYVEAEVTP